MEDCDQKQKQVVQRNLRLVFPPPRMHPWLIFIHGKKEQNQTFYSLSDNCIYLKSIPNMRRKLYCDSNFGWMILLDKCSDDCFLLNPVTLKKIQLPLWSFFKFGSCLLLSPPDEPGCIVVFVEKLRRRGLASFRFCKPGDADWSYQDFEIGKDETVYSAIACGGKIYCHVVTFSMSKLINLHSGTDNKLVMEEEAIPMIPLVSARFMCGLVESSGEVFLVTLIYWSSRAPLEHHVRDITIQKKTEKEWIEVESIGDRAFFIGRSCWTSCSAKELGIQGNTVYVTIPKDRCLYAFDLEEKSLTITLTCPDIKENWSQLDWVFIYP